MKTIKIIVSVLILTISISLFTACEKASPLAANQADDQNVNQQSFAKGKPAPAEDSSIYPQFGYNVYSYWKAQDKYRGGTLNMPDGSFFQLIAGSLKPPDPSYWGKDIKVQMEIDKNDLTNELIFTFGPSGCTFYPAAKIYLSYSQLNIDIPVLYYIDNNGNYIRQEPDYIDFTNKSIIINVDHFSRYAIGME